MRIDVSASASLVSTSGSTVVPIDAACVRSHATSTRARPTPMRGTERHHWPPRQFTSATSSPSVWIPSPARRAATSGWNQRPTGCSAAGAAIAHCPATCSINCRVTGVRRGSPCFAIAACRCDTSTDEPSRSAAATRSSRIARSSRSMSISVVVSGSKYSRAIVAIDRPFTRARSAVNSVRL